MGIIYIFSLLIYLWVLWGIYVLVMGLYRAHLDKRLTKFTYALAAPWLLIGYVIDVLANLVVATIIFLELPKEWTVTSRLKRYILTKTDYRNKLANWICQYLLDVFDPKGKHC